MGRQGTHAVAQPFITGPKLSGRYMHAPDIIERAFELALSSATIEDVRNALRREGYSNVDAHLAGPTIKADLRKRFAR